MAYEIDFASAEEVPAKIKGKFGFLYTVVGKAPYTRKDGGRSTLLTLRACCATCAQPFEQRCGLRAKNLLRRCEAHRADRVPANGLAAKALAEGRKRGRATLKNLRKLRKAGLLD